jgi:drug/metabolite transporter (DMT)-like permease
VAGGNDKAYRFGRNRTPRMSLAQTTLPGTTMSARSWGLLLLLGMIWGGSFFSVSIAVKEIPPLTLVLVRVALAAAALHLYLLVRGPSFALVRPYAGWFLALGFFNNAVPFSLMFIGQTAIGAGLASVLNATTPFWTLIFVGLVFRFEKPTLNKLVGVVVGIAGTAVMIGPGLAAGIGGPVWAKFALIGTALSYAFAFVVSRRLSGLPPVLVATGQLTASTMMMLPVALFHDGFDGFLHAGAGSWTAAIALALVATAFAYLIFFELIRTAGQSNTSLVTMITPVTAVLLGALFLGERLEAFELFGMAIIGLGLVTIDGRPFARR